MEVDVLMRCWEERRRLTPECVLSHPNEMTATVGNNEGNANQATLVP
jgi:hypothetical protein